MMFPFGLGSCRKLRKRCAETWRSVSCTLPECNPQARRAAWKRVTITCDQPHKPQPKRRSNMAEETKTCVHCRNQTRLGDEFLDATGRTSSVRRSQPLPLLICTFRDRGRVICPVGAVLPMCDLHIVKPVDPHAHGENSQRACSRASPALHPAAGAASSFAVTAPSSVAQSDYLPVRDYLAVSAMTPAPPICTVFQSLDDVPYSSQEFVGILASNTSFRKPARVDEPRSARFNLEHQALKPNRHLRLRSGRSLTRTHDVTRDLGATWNSRSVRQIDNLHDLAADRLTRAIFAGIDCGIQRKGKDDTARKLLSSRQHGQQYQNKDSVEPSQWHRFPTAIRC